MLDEFANKSARPTCFPVDSFFLANSLPAVFIIRGLVPSWPLRCSSSPRRSLSWQGGWCWRQGWPPWRSLSGECGRCWGQIRWKIFRMVDVKLWIFRMVDVKLNAVWDRRLSTNDCQHQTHSESNLGDHVDVGVISLVVQVSLKFLTTNEDFKGVEIMARSVFSRFRP